MKEEISFCSGFVRKGVMTGLASWLSWFLKSEWSLNRWQGGYSHRVRCRDRQALETVLTEARGKEKAEGTTLKDLLLLRSEDNK